MKVNNWFKKGCNYQEGVLLYGSLKGHSSNLLRLFLRKESNQNKAKLAYELAKFKEKKTKIKVISSTPLIPICIDHSEAYKQHTIPSATGASGHFYRLNELHKDLHPLSIKQRNDFQMAISLHTQLTSLHEDQENEALSLSIKIESLFDSIAAAQKVLEHYIKHKVVLSTAKSSYENLSPAQLVQRRNNKRISVSKYKKKVNAIESELQKTQDHSQKNKLQMALEKATQKKLQHELELQQLTQLINTNG